MFNEFSSIVNLIVFFLHRVVFGIPEIAWNIIGSVWILTGQIECEPETALPILMKGNCCSYKYIYSKKKRAETVKSY